jgi:MerR family mercuric resistance operon transcriptional regulator
MTGLNIGKLAKACGVKTDTVRYYERLGLLAPAEHSESGYRKYGKESLKRLNFVRRAQTLGFTLEEIKDLLSLSENSEADCGDIRERAGQKIKKIEGKITDLKRMKKSLAALAEYCPGKGRPLSECGILNHFYEENV